MSNHPRIISEDWASLSFDHTIYNTKEFQIWIHTQRDAGATIYAFSVIDNSEYGRHRRYKFQEPELADMCKLKFETIDGNR